ncbi:MAG: hypothetical protein RI920_894 [Pseudomonadota bacterium]|jgi:protein SCO1/2
MTDFTRRRGILQAMMSGAALGALLDPATALSAPVSPVTYHGGRISPAVPIPEIPVQLSDGRHTDLATLVRGRSTALHLMFSGCTTTCPIQGHVFRQVQDLLHDASSRGIQLISMSVNPLDDTPEAMRNWLARFKAKPGWVVARPAPESLDTIWRLFGTSRGSTVLADHATEVSIINARGNLIWRTYELPSPESLAEMLNQA